MRTKYFLSQDGFIYRVKAHIVSYWEHHNAYNKDKWTKSMAFDKSIYPLRNIETWCGQSENDNLDCKPITRDVARKMYPKAFKKN